MTQTYDRTGFYNRNQSVYGGKIFITDFDYKTTLTEIAAKIMADKRFDHQCCTNIKNRTGMGGNNICRK